MSGAQVLPGTSRQRPSARGERARSEDRPARGQAEPQPAASPRYAGLLTRAIAFSVDAAIITAVAAIVGVAVGLGLAALALPQRVNAVIATILGAIGLLWSAAYFVFFWYSTGQTPGARLMAIEVVDRDRTGGLRLSRAGLRFIGLWLAFIPLGAGLLMMLWDTRGRCLQDRLAQTFVVRREEKES